jgi:hypothetical protein
MLTQHDTTQHSTTQHSTTQRNNPDGALQLSCKCEDGQLARTSPRAKAPRAVQVVCRTDVSAVRLPRSGSVPTKFILARSMELQT